MTAAKFVEKYDLYRPEDHRAAEHAIDTINREGIEVVRVVWPDQHGLLRGKALTVPAFLAAMKAGNEITMAPFFFDTANAIVFNPFSPDGGFDFDGLGGSPPRRRPWSSATSTCPMASRSRSHRAPS